MIVPKTSFTLLCDEPPKAPNPAGPSADGLLALFCAVDCRLGIATYSQKKRQTLFKKFHKAYRVFNFSNQLVFFVIEKILRNAKKKGSKLISESAMINGVQVAIVSV